MAELLAGEKAEVAPEEAGEASEGAAEAAEVVQTMEMSTAIARKRPRTGAPTQGRGSMGAATTATPTGTKSRIAPPWPRGNKLPEKQNVS